MEVKKLYQTIEDTGDNEKILQDGPFLCNSANAWLGEGYYFWDTIVSNAHWWGSIKYTKKNKNYMITKGYCDFDPNVCLDLHNNLEQLIQFEKVYYRVIEKIKIENPGKKVTVPVVVEYLKQAESFPYKALRACGIFVKNDKKNITEYTFRIPFENSNDCRMLDTRPPVQICLLEKTSLNFRDYKIVPFDMDIDPTAM